MDCCRGRIVIILGIETSTLQVGCALGGQEGVFGSFHAAKGRHHAEILTPAIQFTCEHARVGLDEVSCIAVGIGPGLFTGLRVGIATAKAMAMALRVPMIGLSSLDLLAYPVRWSSRLIVPVIDARRGEVFWARYRQVSGGVQRLSDYQVGSAEDLAADLQAGNEDALLVGDGALRYRSAFDELGKVEIATLGNAYPTASALVELAQPRALREEFVHPSELEPLYLRKSDAEVNWDLRDAAGLDDPWEESAR
jgi:tRNA threonylcarbamoyladenosine biosynthesis protein TsaB